MPSGVAGFWFLPRRINAERSYPRTKCVSVRPSVRPRVGVRLSVKRVDCDKMNETSAHTFTPHERAFILVF